MRHIAESVAEYIIAIVNKLLFDLCCLNVLFAYRIWIRLSIYAIDHVTWTMAGFAQQQNNSCHVERNSSIQMHKQHPYGLPHELHKNLLQPCLVNFKDVSPTSKPEYYIKSTLASVYCKVLHKKRVFLFKLLNQVSFRNQVHLNLSSFHFFEFHFVG